MPPLQPSHGRPGVAQNLLDLLCERPSVDWLGQVPPDTRRGGPLRILRQGVPGDAHERQLSLRRILHDLQSQIDTIHIWKSDIQNDQIGRVVRNDFESLSTGPRPGKAEASQLEDDLEEFIVEIVVLYDEKVPSFVIHSGLSVKYFSPENNNASPF